VYSLRQVTGSLAAIVGVFSLYTECLGYVRAMQKEVSHFVQLQQMVAQQQEQQDEGAKNAIHEPKLQPRTETPHDAAPAWRNRKLTLVRNRASEECAFIVYRRREFKRYISHHESLNPMNLSLSTARAALLVAAVSLFPTAWSQAEIEVFSEIGDAFTMYLNQMPMNETPAPRVLVSVDPGYYQLRIDFEESGKPDIVKNNFGVEVGMRSTGKITLNKKGEWVVRPFGYVPIPGDMQSSSTSTSTPSTTMSTQPEPTFQTSQGAMTLQDGTTMNTGVSMQAGSTMQGGTNGETVSMNVSMGGGLIPGGMNVNVNVTTTENWSGSGTEGMDQTQWSGHSNGTMQQGWSNDDNHSAGGGAMSDVDFQDYLSAIQSKTFEDSKLSTAKAPLQSGILLSSAQIAQVMRAFTYESSRVDFAIFAHSKCVDTHNYYKTHGAFDFELSIDELNEAIGQ